MLLPSLKLCVIGGYYSGRLLEARLGYVCVQRTAYCMSMLVMQLHHAGYAITCRRLRSKLKFDLVYE